MYRLYMKETGKRCYQYGFDNLQTGCLKENFDTIICSFALHLCPKSRLPDVLWNLGMSAPCLIVISPNKNPQCDGISGWALSENYSLNRIKMKIYQR